MPKPILSKKSMALRVRYTKIIFFFFFSKPLDYISKESYEKGVFTILYNYNTLF